MADEITMNVFMSTEQPGTVVQFIESDQFDMTGVDWNGGQMDTTTTEAVIPLGSVGTVGAMCLKAYEGNTAGVEIGTKPSGSFIRCFTLAPNKPANIWSPDPLYARAASGTQKLHYVALES